MGIGIGALGLLGLGAFSLPTAQASSICTLSDGLQKFAETRESGSTKLELDARKGLLFIVADCTKEEVETALEALDRLVVNDAELAVAKDQLAENLLQELDFAESQKARISDLGLQGTRDVARTLKEWRLNTHLPQTGNANNFILWSKNQELLVVATTRARQIDQTLRTLKLAEREEIKQHVEEGKRDLADATNASQSARESLRQLNNPDTTARLLRTSFNSLSSAYSSFIEVSNEVKKILPF